MFFGDGNVGCGGGVSGFLDVKNQTYYNSFTNSNM